MNKLYMSITGMKFVTITQGKNTYELQTTPVTQFQWECVMKNNPSHFRGSDNLPVESVSWEDAQKFIKCINKTRNEYEYRLPSEKEWEYACRAGSKDDYCFGNNVDQLSKYAWYSNNSGDTTRIVGQLKPNKWGLYDMHGNVCEWCQDLYEGSPLRVLRGGSWFNAARDVRSAYRYDWGPALRYSYVGFRLARTKKQ